jgi:FixJ family two-component response regulator
VRRVARGGTAMDPEVVAQLLVRRPGPLDDLTPREREELSLMAEGLSNQGICRRLYLSPRPSRRTSRASSPSSASHPQRTTTGACWRCSRS